MIELLGSIINDARICGYKVTEFQLGENQYAILKEEIEQTVCGASVNIDKINCFQGVPVRCHMSASAVLFFMEREFSEVITNA